MVLPIYQHEAFDKQWGDDNSTIDEFATKKKKKKFLFSFGGLFCDENYPNTSICNILVNFPNGDSHSCSKDSNTKSWVNSIFL